MSRTELDAAGIHDPALRSAYRRCRALNARHGRTYFLATRLLAPAQRPAVHALYGFARWADDVVDAPIDPGRSPEAQLADRRARLDRLATLLLDPLEGRDPAVPGPDHPIPDGDDVLAAVTDTARRHGIGADLFRDFLHSMRMDLTVTDYPDRAALSGYVRGSAEVIGLQMLPVLGAVVPHEQAAPRAAALGTAFQLTNFVRDVAEDLDRGRVYLPADELAAFGVDRDVLAECRRTGRTDPRVRDALADQIARIRGIYRFAAPGVDMLHPVSRPCVSTALRLYGGILDEVEATGYAVFATRATVPGRRRAAVAAPALLRAVWARRGRRDRAVGGVPGHPSPAVGQGRGRHPSETSST